MIDAKPRAFVSALTTGYGIVRDAASRAIERAECEPVRVEDSPGRGNESPRTACLDGVASCDSIALIFGARYRGPTVAGLRVAAYEVAGTWGWYA
jgi:hypothetical protein